MDKFAKSFEDGFKDKEVLYDLDQEDNYIFKVASLDIYQPTIENVEKFVKKYTLDELSFFPKAVPVNVGVTPTTIDESSIKGLQLIKDAHGVVSLKFHNAVIKLPFIVRDSELIQFDVI